MPTEIVDQYIIDIVDVCSIYPHRYLWFRYNNLSFQRVNDLVIHVKLHYIVAI